MPRPPKPYFKKQTKRWVCTIDGKRITLGKTKDEADKKFYELMAAGTTRFDLKTVRSICSAYGEFLEANRSEATYDQQMRRISDFAHAVPKALKCTDLKPHRISKWADAHKKWGPTTRADAIKYVQQVFAWAERQGIIDNNPVKHVDKPRRLRRDVHYSADQYEQILSHTDREFGDFLEFAWYTGGRPQEVRTLESRQIIRTGNFAFVEFEIKKSKGQTDRRTIMLCDEALQIFDHYAAKNKTGPIFRNSQGNPSRRTR